jgi:hypothetical protein
MDFKVIIAYKVRTFLNFNNPVLSNSLKKKVFKFCKSQKTNFKAFLTLKRYTSETSVKAKISLKSIKITAKTSS